MIKAVPAVSLDSPRPDGRPGSEPAQLAHEGRGARVRRRWSKLGVAAALLLLAAFDLARPARSQASARVLLDSIHLYQATLAPRMAALGVRCRFRPTCSHYAEGAIARHGALLGSLKAGWRILRCGPWTPAGTFDPP